MPFASDPGERHKRMIIFRDRPECWTVDRQMIFDCPPFAGFGPPVVLLPAPECRRRKLFCSGARQKTFLRSVPFQAAQRRRVTVPGRRSPWLSYAPALHRPPLPLDVRRTRHRRPRNGGRDPYGLVPSRRSFTHAALPENSAHSRETDGNPARHSTRGPRGIQRGRRTDPRHSTTAPAASPERPRRGPARPHGDPQPQGGRATSSGRSRTGPRGRSRTGPHEGLRNGPLTSSVGRARGGLAAGPATRLPQRDRDGPSPALHRTPPGLQRDPRWNRAQDRPPPTGSRDGTRDGLAAHPRLNPAVDLRFTARRTGGAPGGNGGGIGRPAVGGVPGVISIGLAGIWVRHVG